jgi:hypothetical protein
MGRYWRWLLSSLAQSQSNDILDVWRCIWRISTYTYHKAQHKIYHEPNLRRSWGKCMRVFLCLHLNRGRVLTPISRHNFPPTLWGVGKISLPISRREIHEYWVRFTAWGMTQGALHIHYEFSPSEIQYYGRAGLKEWLVQGTSKFVAGQFRKVFKNSTTNELIHQLNCTIN